MTADMSSAMSSAMSSPTKSEFDEKETGQAGLGLGLDEDKEYVDKEKNSSEPSSPSPQVQVLLKDDPHAHAHAQIDNTPLEHGHEPLPPAAEAVVDPILRSALATEIENGEPATGIVLSPIRQTLLCAAMTLTYFIGVSGLGRDLVSRPSSRSSLSSLSSVSSLTRISPPRERLSSSSSRPCPRTWACPLLPLNG